MIDFEVIGPDGKPKMGTAQKECIPPREQLDHMKNAGFTFRLNGKPWKPGAKISEIIDNRKVE